MSEKKRARRRVSRGEQRRANGRGVTGLAYYSGGYYLNPQQFGYYTAQTPHGEMSTATSGAGGDSGGGGGDGGGA